MAGVTLNQAALAALLEAEEGPVGRFVAGKAEGIVIDTSAAISAYFHTSPTMDTFADVDFAMNGSDAVVGLVPNKTTNKARRIAANPNLLPQWFRNAIDAVRG